VKSIIISIFLFFCLVAPIAVTFTWLHSQKKQVRKEVKWKMIAGLDKEELVLLKFTKAESQTELCWKHSKEFEYSDQMYDIVDRDIMGDTIYYWCWWDHEETSLNKKLKELVAFALGNDTKSQDTQKRLANFLKSLFHSKTSSWELIVCKTEQETTPYILSYLSIFFPPAVSPPEIS